MEKLTYIYNYIVSYLRSKYIPCEYEYVPEWSDGHDWGPEHHYIVFKF